ncbi:cytochrome C-type protein NrfB family protein [Haemophilus pittmaniae HK 85]|uniref:Cytochrome C-type protein NrfB family protein n=1 Tax=Haemophilus pittmaniae HK 85 TaxID=1035188 RepID=F9Q6Y9_9PAST|nr:cytochrome C-type protein NrfB family protein [Haemophilus pittmaniae HK 85]
MNLTSLISKPAKALALLAMLAIAPMAANAEDVAKPASQLSYEPQMDNQRDPNQYCAKCHKFDQVDKTQTADQSGGELHFGKFHGTHLNQKIQITEKRSLVLAVTATFPKITVVAQKM